MPTVPLPLTVPDVSCFLDVDAFGRETESDLESLSQDVFHRLLEVPGSNIDDPTLGIGVEEMLSGPDVILAQVTRRIDQQLANDDRIDSVTSTLVKNPDGSFLLTIAMTVNGSVTGLNFRFSQASGLVPLS